MKTKNKQKNKIPDGWKIVSTSSILDVRDGTHDTPAKQAFGVPLITSKNITNGMLDFTDYYCISQEDAVQINKRSAVEKGDLLFSMIGSVGNVALVTDDADFCIKNVGLFKHNSKKIIPIFLLHFFTTDRVQYTISTLLNGGIQKFLGLGELRKLKLNLPPLSEQKRIVGVLEVWDEVLEKLKRKIEIKKNIKKGLMQNLLTGKKRVDGFGGEWEVKKLSDICEFKKGSGLSKKMISETGKNKCILYGQIYTTYNEYIKNVKSKTDSDDGVKSKKGDILIPGSTTTNQLDLATATTVFEDDILLGGDINILRKKTEGDYDNVFLSLYLTYAKKHELARLAQGVTIIHLYGNHFKKLEITLPSLEEQKVIADILMSADEEIGELLRKQKLLEEQKRFLLNNLISGEIRVGESVSEQA